MKIFNRFVTVDVLCILFGISSWIEINGMWVEMPILVQRLPEYWNLPSYLTILIQIANLGPLLYSIASKRWSYKAIQAPIIHVTLAIGSISCFLLIFLWSKTTYLFGEMRSTALLSLGFTLATVDCTSSVLYLPFMANYKGKYVISYLIGEGMSGLLPGMVGLIQGVGNTKCREVNETNEGNVTVRYEPYFDQPRFSIEVFFGLLFVMMIMSWIAFTLLKISRVAKKEMITSSKEVVLLAVTKEQYEGEVNTCADFTEERRKASSKFSVAEPALGKSLNQTVFATFLIYQGIICALSYGILTQIQTYSCLPYGNTAYHLTVTLTNIANPLACFVAIVIPTLKTSFISGYFATGVICSLYLIATAVLSPTPPLVGTKLGEILIVSFWVLFVGITSYAKACMASILHEGGSHYALFWAGAVTQIGAATGAILTFIVVNYANVFHYANPCAI